MRILKLMGPCAVEDEKIRTYNCPLGEVVEYKYRVAYGMKKAWFWTWDILDSHYKCGDPQLMEVYEEIRELSKSCDILYHMVGDMMHPEFIKTLSKRYGGHIFTVYNVDGEPASSAILSHPVVYAYDFALTCSKFYDPIEKCVDALKRKGAQGAEWVACGTKYPLSHEAWNYEIDSNRDIDVIFLGADMKYQRGADPYPPNKFKMIQYLSNKGFKVHCEAWQDIDHAAQLYKRSKIGISLHGPSQYGVGNSQRLYDLTVCGVGVVTDGAGYGLDEIYQNDEVMSFLWSNPDEMCAQVDYLLKNPEVRILNAKRAREKTRKLYRNDEDDNWTLRALKQSINFFKRKHLWQK